MDRLNDILKQVQKPGRYIGEETNVVKKTWREGMVSVALAYPDMYEIGMSYLGIKILYHLLNERDDIVCERVFAPWADMEKMLVDNGMKLYGLESKTEVRKFDILGFSLSYELTFTNVLNMLNLSGIPVFAGDRGDESPLVIAGGTCCYNPEPMSSFIDAFVIGDGEEIFPKLIDEYKRLKKRSSGRKDILKNFSSMEGVYVPSLYSPRYDGEKFEGLVPLDSKASDTVKKVWVKDFENAYYPVKQIVPLVKIVHDRIAVEVMRGCPNTCRFCQAGAVNRPVRVRSVQKIREICRETYENTGYENIALLSLSSVNYPCLTELVAGLTDDFEGKGVGVSVPSLRIDEAFYEIPRMISVVKKAGLTFAPEAGGDELRRAIGKDISLEVLSRSAYLAYKNGWQRLKLYFMMGFPGERADEIQKIVNISRELSGLKRKVAGAPAEVRVSVNPFIPKPQTPFQWFGMAPREELRKKRNILLDNSTRKIKFDVNNMDRSFLEGSLARGDRRMGEVIFNAWSNGARMDGWDECFDLSAWEQAFRSSGLDPDYFAINRHELCDKLPWGHIDAGLPSEHFKKELGDSGLADGGRPALS